MIIIGSPYHARLIATLAGVDYDETRNPVIARVTRGGTFLGGVLYTDYTVRAIRMHMAGTKRGWASPMMLWMAFDYPFNQLYVEKVLGIVKSTDEHVLDIDRRLGFKEVGRLFGVIPGGDLVILSMSRDECRWIRKPRLKEAA